MQSLLALAAPTLIVLSAGLGLYIRDRLTSEPLNY
jgi:hypothetical protein